MEGEKRNMKNFGITLVAFTFLICVNGVAFPQEKAATEKSTEVAKSAAEKSVEVAKTEAAKGKAKPEEKKIVSPKPVMIRMGGLVTSVDVTGKTITIQQNSVHKQITRKLRVSEKATKELPDLRAGNLVNAWVSGKVITALDKVG